MSQSLFYWITYSYHFGKKKSGYLVCSSQSLFYWITYSYFTLITFSSAFHLQLSQSLFYWITYSYHLLGLLLTHKLSQGLNPYFIGLPILIISHRSIRSRLCEVSILILLDYLFLLLGDHAAGRTLGSSQSLFYWITYSYFRIIY